MFSLLDPVSWMLCTDFRSLYNIHASNLGATGQWNMKCQIDSDLQVLIFYSYSMMSP